MENNTIYIIAAAITLILKEIFQFYKEKKRHVEAMDQQKIQHEETLKNFEKKEETDQLQLSKLDDISNYLTRALETVVANNKESANNIKDGLFAEQGISFVNKFYLLYKQNHLEKKSERLEDIENIMFGLLKETDTKLRFMKNMSYYLVDFDIFYCAVKSSGLFEKIYDILIATKTKEKDADNKIPSLYLMYQLEKELSRLYMFYSEKLKKQFPF